MTVWRAWRACVIVLATGVLLHAAQDEISRDLVFRTTVDVGVVEVTVRSTNGRLLTDLRSEEFRLTYKGAPVEVVQFSVDRKPLTAAIMVQTTGDLPEHRALAERLADALGPGDRATIGSYGWEVVVSPLLTADKGVLKRVLDEELWYGYFVPISTALHRATSALPNLALRPTVIVVGVDAADEDTCVIPRACVSASMARDLARVRGVSVYGIKTGVSSAGGTNSTPSNVRGGPNRPDGAMLGIAKAFGGYVDVTPAGAGLSPQMAGEILDELRVRYVIGVAPTASVRMDGLDVRVSRPDATVQVKVGRGR